MLKQLSLLDLPPRPIEVNRSVATADRKRLSAQCRRLLDRLIRGPITNFGIGAELTIGNHTARLSEIKQAGCTITATHQKGGIWMYRLDYYPAELIEP